MEKISLISRVRAGDRKAFDELCRKYYAMLVSYARLFLRDDWAEDVVQGFETGGNDYLRKPFAMSELIVRVRALAGRAGVGKARTERVFELGRMRFDAERQRLTCDGVVTELSARESEVLQYLCRNAGEIVPMKTLLVNIWGDDSFFNARSLHVFITRLRHRLVADPSIQLVNVRGVGYKLLMR